MNSSRHLLRTFHNQVARTNYYRSFVPYPNIITNTKYRSYCTDRNTNSQKPSTQKLEQEDQSDDIFNPENTKDLSTVELSRLRVTYGLVKEHAEAIQQGIDEIDPAQNPLIDPRSFDVRRIPEVPEEILKQFRQELPSDVAANTRPVSTQGIWDAITDGESAENIPEVQTEYGKEWAAVDSKTMDSRDFARMQRLSYDNTNDMDSQSAGRMEAFTSIQGKNKPRCPLKGKGGKVNVDFRATGLLSQFLTPGQKILQRRKSGLSAKAQRKIAKAVKTARTVALLHPEPRPTLTVEEMEEIEKSLP